MVVKPQQTWLSSLVSMRATALNECGPRILTATLIGLAVALVERRFGVGVLDLTPVPFSLTGVAIGIFLGFRGKTAYDRFWEGRTLWGALVNNCRNATRQMLTLLHAPADEKEELRALQVRVVYLLIAYANALRHHLRDSDPAEDLRPFLQPGDLDYLVEQRNVPLGVLHLVGLEIMRARQRHWLNDLHVPVVDNVLSELTNLQGGCERIKNTPVPYAYGVLSHRTVAVFCFLLPLGIVDDVKAYTPLVTFLVSTAFFGLDSLGAEVEEPFGTDPHDLPLSALCRTIEINLRQLIEERDIPPFLAPVDCILS
jgi:putative membrane protein